MKRKINQRYFNFITYKHKFWIYLTIDTYFLKIYNSSDKTIAK
jgi:hypothetical protein